MLMSQKEYADKLNNMIDSKSYAQIIRHLTFK